MRIINKMKAVLVIAASLFSLSFAASVAQGNYFIQAGDEFTAGQEITSVPGVTLVMPKYEQKSDTEKETGAATATSNYADADFVASTGGNGGNPVLTDGVWHGTTYTFKVEKDGFILAGVVLNANKTLVIKKNDTEDVLSTAKYNLPSAAGGESQELDANSQVAAKAYGVVSFPVAAGNTYNIHCNGSKMGFFGFKFTEEELLAEEEESDFLPTSELKFDGATVLSFSNMGLYGSAGTKANKIVGAEDTEAEDYAIQAANASLMLETAPNVLVNGASVKAIALPAGEQVVISLPQGMLATKLSIIAFANVYDSTATYRPTYFSEINGKEYTPETIDTLKSYRNFENPDTFVVACGELEQLTLTAAGEQVAFVAIVEAVSNPYKVVEIEGTELLRNGDFETWKDGLATYWASVKTTASNGAALTKTDDAYEGDAAIQITNASGNKRLAYRELKLKPGTYYFSFMAKAVKGAKKMPSIQYGFVPSVDGKVGNYVYQDTKTVSSPNKWIQYIDTLVFENDTVINLLVMSKKNTADVLVDAASLKTENGGLISYLETFEYEDNVSFYVYEGTKDTISFSVAPFGGNVALASSNAAVASAAINASAIIVSALAPGKAAITASLDGVTKTINYDVLEIGTGIETEQNVQGAKGVELVGKSYTVDAAYVLGEIENGYETFVTNGNADNTLTVNVKKGAHIKSIKIEAGANDEGLAESAAPITITAISIDGGDNILMPAEAGAKPLTVVTKVIGVPAYPAMTTILEAENVKDNITFWFDNTNVKANKAVTFKYTIVYEIPEIKLTVSADTIQVDQTAEITAEVTPASYIKSRGYSVVYALASDYAATISGNVVTGVNEGVAPVFAYLVNGTDTAAVAFKQVVVVAKPLPPTPPTPPTPEAEVAWKNLGVVDFEDATTYLDGWTFSGKSAPAQVETEDGKHYLSNYASGGAGTMTYTVSNAKYLAADVWKVVFEYNLYTSNSKESRLEVKGVNNDLIFYATNPSWSTNKVTVFDAAGTEIGQIDGVSQNRDTRGKSDCVAPAHIVTLEGQADGIYLTISALDGTDEIAKVKVQDYDHVSAIYQGLGNQLSAAAFNDITFYQAGVPCTTDVLVVDFEDATSYLDGWSFSGKSAPAQVETADGKHYLSNYASGGAGTMTYTVSNAKFLAAEGWDLVFEYNLYTSNSKESRLEVKGVNNDVIFYATNPSWSTNKVTVFDAAGTELGQIDGVSQNRDTRGKSDCVAPAHKIALRGQADGIYLTITALDGTEEIAKVKVQEFDHVSAIYQGLGNQLSAAAFNDMIFSIDDVATWGDAVVVDFEDAVTYLDGWTFSGKSAPAQVETADGKHYLSNYASGGAGTMTYTVSNNKVLTVDEWNLKFEYNLYTSNSKESRLEVKGVNNDVIFYATNPSWSTNKVTVFDAAGTELGQIDGVSQNRDTRGKSDCVAPAHIINLHGQADGIYLTITALDGTEEIAKVKVQEFDHVSAIYQGLGNQLSAAAFNDIVFSVLAAGESLEKPKFTITGNTASSNLVEIKTADEGAEIFYSVNGKDTTAYTAGFRVYETSEISAWTTKNTGSEIIKSDAANVTVTAGVVPAPKYEVIAVDGLERTIKLSDDSARTNIFYGIGSAPSVAYAEPFKTTAADSIFVVATLKDLYTETVFNSETVNAGVLAGSWIKLDTVMFKRVHFDAKPNATAADTAMEADYAAKELSAWQVYLDPDQTLCNPEKKISLIYVTSDHKDTTALGTYNAGDTVYHIPYGGVFATAHADGYADSYGHVFFRPAPKLDTVMWIDFDTIAIRMGQGTGTVTLSANDHFVANGVEMAPVTMVDSVVDVRFGVQNGTNWLSRNAWGGGGLYQYNGGYRSFGVSGVQAHQLVLVEYSGAIASTSANLEENSSMSDGNVHVYNCIEAGNVQFSVERYQVIKRIGVLNSSDVVMNPVFSIDRVNGNEHFVKIESTGSEDCPAYDYYYSYVTSDSLNSDYTLANNWPDTLGFTTSPATSIIDRDGNVIEVLSFDTAWVIKDVREYWTPWAKYEEPIGITDTTVFRAYAWYQDLKSDVVIDTIAAGTPVQLARPVITYVGSTETADLYQITVDNSGVISQPKCQIWNNITGMVENGDTVAVDKDMYGWMLAQAGADGYNWSECAFRYLDARESHNEPYTAFNWANYASDTIMPASTADFEIGAWARFTSTTLRASGNVYFHKWMDQGFNSIVLPFVPAYVTDAEGNVLTEGEDYKIYNFTSKGNGNATADTDLETLLTGDLEKYRRTARMNAYTGAYLYYTENAGEVIFVSSKGVQFRANNTMSMAARTEGWQVAINNTFKDQESTAAFYEVVANPAGMTGSALVRRDSGTVIAPFTAVLLVDTAFMNANDTVPLIYAHKGAAIDIYEAALANDAVEVKFSAQPVTYNVDTDEYEVVEGLNLTYTVEMFLVTEEGIQSLGTATAKNVEGANYTATIKGGEAGQTVLITVTTSIQGSDVLITTLGEGATGIETISDDAKFSDGPIYNINGMRVEKVQKGQNYIMNGKKFQVR